MYVPMISVIAAIGKKRELGIKNKIPWHIRKDLLRFKHLTLGKTVIMGRKTFESVLNYYKHSKNPIPNRRHIIVTHNKNYQTDLKNSYVVFSMEEAIDLAKKIERDEVFISGGAQMFNQGIKYADKLYLTIVNKKYPEADAFFPDYSAFKKVIFEENHFSGEIKFKFVDLIK